MGYKIRLWHGLILTFIVAVFATGSFTPILTPLWEGSWINYPGAWEASTQIAGVSFSGMMDGTYPAIWKAGSPRPVRVGQVLFNTPVHMMFDPDGNEEYSQIGADTWVSGKHMGYPNVDIVIGDFYQSEENNMRLVGDSVVYAEEPITIIQGDYEVKNQVKYILEKWDFDVMIRFWSAREEMGLLKNRLIGSSLWAMEGESFHEDSSPLLINGAPDGQITDDAYDGNPVDVKVFGEMWVTPWDSRRDPETGVLSEDIWAAIANMRVVSVKKYLSDEIQSQSGVGGILDSKVFNSDTDNDGFFTARHYVKYDNGELYTQSDVRVPMYAEIGEDFTSRDSDEVFSQEAIAKYNAAPGSRSHAYYEVWARGLPAWATMHTTIDGGEQVYVDWFSTSAVYTIRVEVLRSAEFEIERTRIGGPVTPPVDPIKDRETPSLWDWFNTLGEWRWIIIAGIILALLIIFMPAVVAMIPIIGGLLLSNDRRYD